MALSSLTALGRWAHNLLLDRSAATTNTADAELTAEVLPATSPRFSPRVQPGSQVKQTNTKEQKHKQKVCLVDTVCEPVWLLKVQIPALSQTGAMVMI